MENIKKKRYIITTEHKIYNGISFVLFTIVMLIIVVAGIILTVGNIIMANILGAIIMAVIFIISVVIAIGTFIVTEFVGRKIFM